jgi:hypothetical protein
METLPDALSADALLCEADMRMAQALDNFFQRSRTVIQDAVLRAIGQQMTPSSLAIGQTCMDWLSAYPDALSSAFADQFRQHLARPESFERQTGDHPAELELVDDAKLRRQLAEDKAAALLSEDLQPELLLLFGRLLALRKHPAPPDTYGPHSVMHALSRALDSLDFAPESGTLLMQCATVPLRETLKQTYTALNHYLNEQGVEEHAAVVSPPPPAPVARQAASSIGQDILAHIHAVASQDHAMPSAGPHGASGGTHQTSGTVAAAGGTPLPATLPRFIDSLTHWQSTLSQRLGTSATAPVLVLRQLQQEAHRTDAGTLDLAVLDAVAGLFEFILDDPDVSPRYKSGIAQLQIPALRVALVSPDFFSDDHHPARQVIDLLGLFSRQFPAHHPSHLQALAEVEAACGLILGDPDHQSEAFAQAHDRLVSWLAEETVRTEAELAYEVADLELIERQELGTLLALENLNDLTTRYSAPESVLRRLEAAWVPYMASLYVAEMGEGPDWRAACTTLLHLFLSLQSPNEDERETRLQSIPHINADLRHGLLTQGFEPADLKDFFAAITATQTIWIRPVSGQHEAMVSSFVPQHAPRPSIEALAHQLMGSTPDNPILLQTQQLLEGDWVDFDPPFEGLATARVAWVGVHGYLLFCDSEGDKRFSLDCDQLAAEIHAGRARIPELSLTRKAMVRLKTQLQDSPG